MELLLSDCQLIFESYELGQVQSLEHLPKGYTNANFKVCTNQGNYLLRICLEKDPAQIQYEMDLLAALKKIDFPAAYPLPNQDKQYLNHTKSGSVVLYEFVEGSEPQPNRDSVAEIALAAARLNKVELPPQLQRSNLMGFGKCADLIQQFPTAKHSFPEIFAYFEEQTQHLIPAMESNLKIGLIHGDLFTDNTLFRNNKLLAILDFEEACFDQLMIEVGVAINGFCFVNNELNQDLLKMFLQSYQTLRPLSSEEIKLLPYFIQWGAHAMITWHLGYLMEEATKARQDRVEYLVSRVKCLREQNLRD